MMLSPGTKIHERYRLEAVIGEGGMGVVFDATDLVLGRSVAIKVVKPDRDASGGLGASRLLREARVVATLKSPHVVQVLDVGEHEGEPYVVMERLHGRTAQALVGDGPSALTATVDLVIGACHALDEAHFHGVIHRDIKPSNLFLAESSDGSPGSTVKVIDFGVSKALPHGSEQGHGETQTGTLLGSPSFMAPEQIRSSKDVDGRADVWSLGVVLHLLLSGTKPFAGESLLDLMTAIVHEPAPRLRGSRPEIPEEIEAIVGRCLSKNRAGRPSAAELARALAPFASPPKRELALRMALTRTSPASSRSRVPPSEASAASEASATASMDSATLSASVTAPLPRPRARSSGARAAIVAAIVLLGLVGLIVWLQRLPAPASAASTAPAPPPSASVSSPEGPVVRDEAPPAAADAPLATTPAAPGASSAARPRPAGRAVAPSPHRAPPKAKPKFPAKPEPEPAPLPPGPAPTLPRTPD